MKHFIDIKQVSKGEIDALINKALDIIENPDAYCESMHRKKIATLFFEPSTRTRLSFEAAMIELGGQVLGFSEASSSSASKGESVADTVRVVSCYADIIAMRHPKEGAPMLASKFSEVPIINAGDGGHAHPTQTMTDLLTITREKGGVDGITVGMVGDLKFGRTVHSLIEALSLYNNVKIVLISPDELKVPGYIKNGVLEKNSMQYMETGELDSVIGDLDVLYMTRVQKERFFNEEDYLRLKDSFILDEAKVSRMKKDAIIMHPLPRVNEISVKVDEDPRAAYFRQVRNGKYVRMSIIHTLLGGEKA